MENIIIQLDINQEMSCAILPLINCFFEKKNKSFWHSLFKSVFKAGWLVSMFSWNEGSSNSIF